MACAYNIDFFAFLYAFSAENGDLREFGREICAQTALSGRWGAVRSLTLTIEFASKLAGIFLIFFTPLGG